MQVPLTTRYNGTSLGRFDMQYGPALACVLCLLPGPVSYAETVHHVLDVLISPEGGELSVTDTVALPGGGSREFSLHADLTPESHTHGVTIERLDTRREAVPVTRYALSGANGGTVLLSYNGRISHALQAEPAREGARAGTPGLIASDGVYLDPSAYWYPDFGTPVSFELRVKGPPGWQAVSQGGELGRRDPSVIGAWEETHPQQGIWLVANAFTRYARSTPWGEAQVFLRERDAALAERYLSATSEYVERYSHLIGPYPYAKFALVENIWESGWGMPSFTLLGPRVIRLPFIPHTSYPHEVLHNWWGNGVFVDPAGGNWAEGLTTYLADHLLAAERGDGADHRRAALQAWADYVGDEADFALADFVGNRGEVSQAIGYSKGMMLYHMLRLRLGEAAFISGLRRLYREHRFARADFSDVQAAFAGDGRDLSGFFRQWVQRRGAPGLALEDLTSTPADDGFRLTGRLRQTQAAPPYHLQVPLAVQLQGGGRARERMVELKGRSQRFEWRLPAAPLRVAADPRFDVFRRLDPGEIPPSFAQGFSAERRLFVLPGNAPPPLKTAYRDLARAWARPGDEIVDDRSLESLPTSTALWLLGWSNGFRPWLEEALEPNGVLDGDSVRLGEDSFSRDGRIIAVTARHPKRPEQPLVWVTTDGGGTLESLARKLPHYGKYSYAVFTGPSADKQSTGQWPAAASPLRVDLEPGAPPLRLEPRPPLEAAAPVH